MSATKKAPTPSTRHPAGPQGIAGSTSSPKTPKPLTPKKARRLSDLKWLLALGALAALPAFTGDMYLPALPHLMQELHTSQTLAQTTIMANLVGNAIAQLIIGPLSDRFGRRHPLMVGLVIHILMSAACAFSHSIWTLMIFRFFQGVGNAASQVTSMAMLRDKFTGNRAAQMLSRLMLVIGFSPLFAPTVGGIFVDLPWTSGWRLIFLILGIIGVGLLIAVWKFIPETLAPDKRLVSSGFKETASVYRGIVKDGTFLCQALIGGLALGILLVWVSSAPFVLQQEWGMSPFVFSLAFAVNGLGLVGGSQLNSMLVTVFGPKKLLRIGAISQACFITILLIMSYVFRSAGPLAMGPLFILIFHHGFTMPNNATIALDRQKSVAGTASAVLGMFQYLIAGLLTPIASLMGGGLHSMALTMLFCSILMISLLALGTNLLIDKRTLFGNIQPDTKPTCEDNEGK